MSDTPRALAGPALRGLSSGRGFGELRLLAVAQIAPLPIQIGLSLLTAMALTPSERGPAVFVVSAGAIGGSIVFGSFHVGAVAAFEAQDRRALLSAGICVLGLSIALATLAAFVAIARPPGLGLYSATNVALILTGMALYVIMLNVSRTLQGLGETVSYCLINLVPAVVYAVGVGVSFGPLGMRTSSAVTTPWLVSALFAGLLSLVLFTRALYRAGRLCRLCPAASSTRVQSVRSSLVAHGASVSQQIAYRADLFLLGVFSTGALVGIYTLSVSLGQLVWVIPEIIALSVFADTELRKSSQWRHHLERRLRATFIATSGVALLLAATAAVLLLVLLPAYRTSYVLLLILLPGTVVASGARVILAALTARDERALLARAGAGTLLLSMLYLPAIVLFDVLGAAVVTPVVYVGQYVLLRQLWLRSQ
jgi:O-antigen/teichoic acid export membrane protein